MNVCLLTFSFLPSGAERLPGAAGRGSVPEAGAVPAPPPGRRGYRAAGPGAGAAQQQCHG